MSRIGKKPVAIPAGVTASMADGTLSVKGPKGELTMPMSDLISYEIKDEGVSVQPANKSREARAFWGMQRTLVQNLIVGVTEGYTTKMEIFGVGYRVALKGKDLEFALGYSHPVLIEAPEGIAFAVEPDDEPATRLEGFERTGEIADNH